MNKFVTALLFAGASIASSSALADAANGKRLWDENCTSCHGAPPSGRQVTRGSTAAALKAAFENISAMSQFRMFSQAQLEDLASYIRGDPLTGPAIRPLFNWMDIWYNETESGWGLNITQHADTATKAGLIVAVLYHYDINGNPAWYILSGGEWKSSTVFSGKIYKTKAPAQNGTFSSGQVQTTEAGTMTLTFTNKDNGQVNYTIDGRSVAKQMKRTPF